MNTKIVCGYCKEVAYKYSKEIDRQKAKGRTVFYCSIECSGLARIVNPVIVERTCDYCNSLFTCDSRSKTVHCSAGCASSNSMTPKRLRKARISGHKNVNNITSIVSIAKSLKAREGWKYRKLESKLNRLDIVHKFEYPLKGTRHVFDLAIRDKNLFIEFDAGYHKLDDQIKLDCKKDKAANKRGWTVVRVDTEASKVLPQKLLNGIVY